MTTSSIAKAICMLSMLSLGYATAKPNKSVEKECKGLTGTQFINCEQEVNEYNSDVFQESAWGGE